MMGHTYTITALISVLLPQAHAQLLSCLDVKCPTDGFIGQCEVDGIEIPEIGVANFTSRLASVPLTWTIGYSPGVLSNSTDSRHYYLGTPQGLRLSNRTDVTGCAFLFTGVEQGLLFANAASGTCADVLGSKCVSDLTSQASDMVANSTASSSFQCSSIAQSLQNSPPVSCTKAGTWGSITAKAITGPSLQHVGPDQSCVPTTNRTYDLYHVAETHQIGSEGYINIVTPLMTIFAPAGNSSSVLTNPEVHMNCMAPVEDRPTSNTPRQGTGVVLTVWASLPSMVIAATVLVANLVLAF